jgi:hypothetical protein
MGMGMGLGAGVSVGAGAGSGGGAELDSLVGPGSLPAVLLFLGKAALCWCTGDSELANSGVDMGTLVMAGGLCEATVRDPALAAFQPVLIQACVGHILLELIFNTAVIRRIDPETKYYLTNDLVAHHVATLATTVFAVAGGCGEYRQGAFLGMACELAATEMTTLLPVAFHQAVRNRKMSGSRVSFFTLTMPASFVWRTHRCYSVLKRFHADIMAKGGPREVRLAWLGLAGTASLVGLNAWWTFKIFRGTLKALRKQPGKGEGKGEKKEEGAPQGGHPPASSPSASSRSGDLRRVRGSSNSLVSEPESEDPLSPLRIA